MRRVGMACALAIVLSACRSGPPGGEPSSDLAAGLRRCDEVPTIVAAADHYRDSPIYVANEMPTEDLRAWAASKPGFQELWIDRDHLGWVTFAFSTDADARQHDLEARFPGVGAVAVGVDWTMVELQDLQQRVTDELQPALTTLSSGILVNKGVVEIGLGALTDERLSAVAQRFAGERVCVDGAPASAVIPEGPQPAGGDGWRLLADERGAGSVYRTGLAWDEVSYAALWSDAGVHAIRSSVGFENQVVVWFGAVYGSSCPDIRLDDVVVDRAQAVVHAKIVLPGVPRPCTLDAVPHAYVVALDRSKLPSGPFVIQLGADDPPPGAPEERTIVDVDLSQPGSVPQPGRVHPAEPPPTAFVLESGGIAEPGIEYTYRLKVQCGIEWLGELNDLAWRSDEPTGPDWLPDEWRGGAKDDGSLEVKIVLEPGLAPQIRATAASRTIVYRPTRDQIPACD